MRLSLCLALAICLGSVVAAAQTSADGSIRGTIKDEQGAVLPGVAVTATSPDAPGIYTAVSDAAGEYRLRALPPGRFTLAAELPGFAKYVRENVVSRAGLNLQVDVTMRVGAMTEVVEVKAETPMLESRTATRAVNISGEFQRSVPIASRRNWSDFLELVPGITTSAQSAEFYFVRGAVQDAHVIRVDGASIDSGFQGGNTYVKFNLDAVQDVQVKTGGTDAAAPLGVGAVIDVATPSGTNELRGVGSLVYQGQRWNDQNLAQGTVPTVQLFQSDLSGGGPLRRNHAWFFVAYRYHDRETAVFRTADELNRLRALAPGFEPIDAQNRGHYWFAKTTFQVDRHQAYAWYQYDRNADNLIAPTEAALFLERPRGGGAVATRLSSAWTDTLLSQVVFSYTNKRFDQILFDHDKPGRQLHANSFLSGGRRVGAGQIALLDNRNAPEQLTNYPKVSLSADTTYHRHGPLGSHELQGGVFFQAIDGLTTQGFFNNGFILEEVVLRNSQDLSGGMLPFHRRIYDQPELEEFHGRSSNVAFYLQDAWRPLSRLTINGGVRVDIVRQNDEIFDLQTVQSTEIAPRIGVNYLVTADGRDSIQANWTRIFDTLARTRLTLGTTAAAYRDLYDNDLDGTFETVLVNPASTTRNPNQLLDPDYHQPNVDEWAIGYRRQLRGQVAAGVTFVRREYRNRPATIETNGIYDGGVLTGYRNEAVNDILFVTNNRYNWPVYSGLEVEVAKQGATLQLLASYTRQWRHLAGTWQPNDPLAFLQPDVFANDKGIGATHATDNSLVGTTRSLWRDHTARAGVAYQAPWGILLATNYAFQSGQWSAPIVMQLPAADPRFGPPTIRLSNGRVVSNPLATPLRIAFPTRGEGQFTGPSVHNWNVRIGRQFSFGRHRLSTNVDLFNILNRGDFEQLQTGANQIYSPNSRLGANPQPPRAAQLTVRIAY